MDFGIMGPAIGVWAVMHSAMDFFKNFNATLAACKSYRADVEKLDLEINCLKKQVSDLTPFLCSPKSEDISNLKKSTAALLAEISILSGSTTLDLYAKFGRMPAIIDTWHLENKLFPIQPNSSERWACVMKSILGQSTTSKVSDSEQSLGLCG
ncbi:hypothetical protein CCUS01_11448 [Colletotrichum cuscutae]|uniref:Uncharacterized protein n=1 Tax=Colletotrichum cuscutae TaxID=1209917 RepID=A0AAI9XIN2_9PEZI|nr:hypothetical protein CCUS01_11448 [Colletotrichum cuscutae]